MQQSLPTPTSSLISAFAYPASTLVRRGSSASECSAAQLSPPSSTQRASSQLLRLESRASDPYSFFNSSRQASLTLPESQAGAQQPSRTVPRVLRDNVGCQYSVGSQTSSEGAHEPRVMPSSASTGGGSSNGGDGGGGGSSHGGGGSGRHQRSSLSLNRVSLSALQVTSMSVRRQPHPMHASSHALQSKPQLWPPGACSSITYVLYFLTSPSLLCWFAGP